MVRPPTWLRYAVGITLGPANPPSPHSLTHGVSHWHPEPATRRIPGPEGFNLAFKAWWKWKPMPKRRPLRNIC